ncbi:regulatory protein, FmdB family [Thermodesulfatator indicus DSM 15286]|uniref:Regulatory protein, FmdB family n=1 Tax=Thermodesulfatator indicus (strain DSM 15286 / JCM 11887 / CIR29812) TaxID=667014 RepID=F8ACV6_THEID|nr:zinc ribbon domain-containing protein [Thermodesulfatator indicus]AEH44747.1 regulatory protein, FmdB family [Thermodesulfatator indicus DSM 15286]
MPIYEFTCSECGETFEELVLGGSYDGIKCPKCGSEKVEKIMSACAFKCGANFVSASGSSACSSCTATSCSSCSGK